MLAISYSKKIQRQKMCTKFMQKEESKQYAQSTFENLILILLPVGLS